MFKSGNGCFENIGYIFGAMANLSDILIGSNPQKVDLVTEHTKEGHSALVEPGSTTGEGMNDPNGIISVGPDYSSDPNGSWHWMKGTNHWDTHTGDGSPIWRHSLNVNKEVILRYAKRLNDRERAGCLHYSVELSSCVTHTSIALNKSGIFNIGIHPYLLSTQMYLWSNGLRPWSFSFLLNLQ